MNFIRRSFTYVWVIASLIACIPGISVFGQVRPSIEQVTIEKKLIDGKKYTMLGDWEKAEAIFKSILDEDVQNSAACYELSRTLSAAGRPDEALTFIQKAIRIEPDNEWYQLMEADIHEKAGNLPAAMDVYDRLIQLRPKRADYYEMQINFCKKTGQPDRLLKVLDQYESLRGVNESITRTRFETLDALGKKEEALATLNRLTEVFPSNIEYKFLAASYAKKINQEDKAQLYYRDVLRVDPENSRAKLAMASAEKQAGNESGYLQSITPVITNPSVDIDVKLQELIPYVVELSKTRDAVTGMAMLDLIRQLVRTHPKEAKSYAIQGDVMSILGKDEEAIESYKQATVLNSGVYVVWEQLIGLLMATRSYDELILQCEKGMEAFPNQAYLYYASGLGMYKKKQYNEALDRLNEALVMTGRSAGQKIRVFNILGLVYDELGDLEKSSIAFETSLSLDPKNPETMAHYSLALSRRIAQSEKALSMTEKVLGMSNLPPAIHEVLAQVLYNQKKYTEAYNSIQVLLAADPYGDAYNLAGDICLKLGKTPEAVSMWQKALDAGASDSDIKRKIAEHKAQ
jgi:tetratricopeptide (TPR) repeat protein